MKSEYSVRSLCEALEVSSSGYYDWCRRQQFPCARHREDGLLLTQIRRFHQESRQTYGSPRILEELRRIGHHPSRKRVARLMSQNRLRGLQSSRWRIKTTDSAHEQPIAENRLLERAAPCRPNEVWVSDITYISTEQGWLYVAGILDLYSRRIVGWAMGDHLDASLVISAWNMAIAHRKPPAGLIHHSDRGVQYACTDYRRALARSQAIASMSRKANCYDNAFMESFWGTLKKELVHRSHFQDLSQAQKSIFDYIEIFYNRKRLHSALGYKSPVDFENQNN